MAGARAALPYQQWLELVNEAEKKGFASDELCRLQTVYPVIGVSGYDNIVAKETAKLAAVLMKRMIDRFQSCVNRCLEEADTEILRSALRDLKQNIRRCFFFHGIEEYPHAVKRELCDQMVAKLTDFAEEYAGYVKRAGENDHSSFMEEFDYLCKKAGLKKYIEGFH